MPDLPIASSSVNAQLADAAREPQSTHDTIASNSAALHFQQLKKRYLLSASPKSSRKMSRLHLWFSSESNADFEQTVDQAIESLYQQSQLSPSAIRYLKRILASGTPLSPTEDKVVFMRNDRETPVATDLFLPLREVFACVWLAINDLSTEVWPVTKGVTQEQLRDARLSDFNQTILELSKVKPELCPPGIRNACLQVTDGFMGKRLPIDKNDLLYLSLHEFVINLLKEELHIKLITDKDPHGDARVIFAQQFKKLFLPWMLKNKTPKKVFSAFLRKGGSAALEQYLLEAFYRIGVIPDEQLKFRIVDFSTTSSFRKTPVNFTPFLATVEQWLAKQASFRFLSKHPDAKQKLALQVIEWLKTGFSVEKNSTDVDGIYAFYLLNQLFDALDRIKEAQILHVMTSSNNTHPVQSYRNACSHLQSLLDRGTLSFTATDFTLLKEHLAAFGKGYILNQEANHQDTVTEYFTRWFDPSIIDEENGYEEYTERARLFLEFEAICAHDAQLLTGPGSSNLNASLSIYMNESMLLDFYSINPLPTQYQINRVFLHALWFEPKLWTPLFSTRLAELISYIDIHYTGSDYTRYPESLRRQLKQLLTRFELYTSGQEDQFNASKLASDGMEEWPVLTSSLINPAESFRLIKYLCALPNCPDSQIDRLLNPSIGFDPNAKSYNDQSILGYASERGNQFIVQRLLVLGAQPDVLDMYGETPLAQASKSNPKIVMQLLKQGSNPDLSKEGRSKPLHIAAQSGAIESARLLLRQNATVDVRDSQGLTPLHLAVRNGHLEMVELLINNHADVNGTTKNGLNPIYLALLHRHNSIARLLLHSGAIIDKIGKKLLINNYKVQPEVKDLVDYNINLWNIGFYDNKHVMAFRIASKMIDALLYGDRNQPVQIELSFDETDLIRRGTLRILRIKHPVIDTLIPEHQFLHIQQGIFRPQRRLTIAEQLTEPFELSELCTLL